VNATHVEDRIAASARYEIKMTCEEMYLPEVRSWVQLHPERFRTAYPSRQVNNIYLDTFEMDHLDIHLSGVSDREKLRFRWYGGDDTAVQGILELKGKTASLSWKKQCPIACTFDLTTLSWIDWMAQVRAHADPEASIWLLYVERPTLLNRYRREYYVTFDGQIRLTVDYAMRVYDQRTTWAPNLELDTPIERLVVLEVKSSPAFSSRLSDIFTAFPLRVARNSKYVTGMQSLLWP
jgi:hypothetical protein